jgi:hypothetical protein
MGTVGLLLLARGSSSFAVDVRLGSGLTSVLARLAGRWSGLSAGTRTAGVVVDGPRIPDRVFTAPVGGFNFFCGQFQCVFIERLDGTIRLTRKFGNPKDTISPGDLVLGLSS